jgi:hypothetical protein
MSAFGALRKSAPACHEGNVSFFAGLFRRPERGQVIPLGVGVKVTRSHLMPEGRRFYLFTLMPEGKRGGERRASTVSARKQDTLLP